MLALVNWGTFDSATGGTFQSDTDGTFHSDIPGTFESDMGGTFKVLQSVYGYEICSKGKNFRPSSMLFYCNSLIYSYLVKTAMLEG